jgi:hypothetical protein
MKEHNRLLVELEIMAAAWWEFTKKGGDVPTEAITAVCVAYDTYQDKRVNDYRETVTKAKHNRLLEALAQFLKESAAPMPLDEFLTGYTADKQITAGHLDQFLTGYAGDDWQNVRARTVKR